MSRGVIWAASLALSLGGVISLAQGVAVPVKAELAQNRLRQVFEQRLKTAIRARSTAPALAPGRRHGAAADTAERTASTLPAEGPVARITVERLGIDDVVLAGNGTHEQLAEGPTMIKQGDAASPVTVLAAHRDTHFLFIRDLRAGDEVRLQFVSGLVERYRVTQFETVRWDRFSYKLDRRRPRLALTTCFPFGGTEYGGPWRRVAWAERI